MFAALPIVGNEPVLKECGYAISPLCFPEIFSGEECDAILALGRGRMRYLSIETVPIEGLRTALTLWLDPGAEVAFILERLSYVARQVNGFYGFDMAGFRDPLLMSEYRVGDGIDWHFDVAEAATSTRKLSLSVQLSDPGDYDGGALEFMPRGELAFARGRGSVIVFPSYLCHRVTRVTRGARAAMVCWVHGPAFR